jgi:curved DNA-binding protein CbpA
MGEGEMGTNEAVVSEGRVAGTYYGRLGVRPSASVGEIRRVYHELSLLYHPDTTTLPLEVAHGAFQSLNEAYATLSHPERRLQYDLSIGCGVVSRVREFPTVQQEARRRAMRREGEVRDRSAYLEAEDRSLSAGEVFAVFWFGVTFLGCLGLVVVLSWR